MISRFGLGRLFGRRQEHKPKAQQQARPSTAQPISSKWVIPEPGTTILIVDDSKTIQAVLTRQLIRQGYQCISAYDGGSAVEVTRKQKPALILMDVVMPIQNGFQATREIRKDPDPKIANVPVIIMSGNAQPSEELWSVKIKANAFLAKPFEDDELFSNMDRLLYPHVSA